MILIDYSGVSISAVLVHKDAVDSLELDFVRHCILNSIRSLVSKFKAEYGTIVIACDSKNYWRKQKFPYYKAKRKQARDDSFIDWTELFECTSIVKNELKEIFPYKVIEVPGAEADDVIGVLSRYSDEKNVIVSRDRDYRQLISETTSQWDPIDNVSIICSSPDDFLLDKIIRGDAGDGVPNILSDDDTFVVSEKRQGVMTKKRFDYFFNTPFDKYEDMSHREKFLRNKMLIDLKETPIEIRSEIISEYEKDPIGSRRNILSYLIKNKLKVLSENISDF